MVKVTDKDYYLDGFAKQVGDAVSGRVLDRKQDILIFFNGAEGSGKTNASIALAYYIAEQTGREFTVDNVFFNIDDMRKYAGQEKEKIIVWDEAALGGLANDWTNFSQKKLISMLMVCRKKRHVFIFNIPRAIIVEGTKIIITIFDPVFSNLSMMKNHRLLLRTEIFQLDAKTRRTTIGNKTISNFHIN